MGGAARATDARDGDPPWRAFLCPGLDRVAAPGASSRRTAVRGLPSLPGLPHLCPSSLQDASSGSRSPRCQATAPVLQPRRKSLARRHLFALTTSPARSEGSLMGAPLTRIIREVASHVGTAPSPWPSPITRCIGKSNGSPGEGTKNCAPLPRWERARVRVVSGIRE